MTDILIMGEMLVEIMREKEGTQLYDQGVFLGPYPSGAPAICIDTAARLGCRTAIIGGVGKDDFGRCLLERLKKDGVDVSHVIESRERSTGCAFVTYFEDGSRKFIFHMGNTPAVEAKAPGIGEFRDVKYMHIMGCSLMSNQVFAQEILKTMRMMTAEGAKISFDPNIRRKLWKGRDFVPMLRDMMFRAQIVLLGADEAEALLGVSEARRVMDILFEKGQARYVAVKNGAKGAIVGDGDGLTEIPPFPCASIDPVGAGDAFNAPLICGILEGKDVADCGRMGAVAGALATETYGDTEGYPSMEQMETAMKGEDIIYR